MLKTLDEKLSRLLFVVILPFLLFFMSYYGYESAYVDLKSMEKAPDFMFSSVYAYRVIPNFLMLYFFEGLQFLVDHYLSSAKSFILKNGTIFYHSIFVLNLVFFILSSFILDKILSFRSQFSNKNMIRIIHLLVIFFITIVQYVPTNCDMIAVFFYLSGIWFTLQYFQKKRKVDFVFLCFVIVISTFVRETSCLNIAFFAAFFVDFKKMKSTLFTKDIFLLVFSFVLPYFLLKTFIPQETSFFEGIYIIKNLTSPFNIAGLLFGILGFYFAYRLGNIEQQKILMKYLFFSLPYLLMITLVGLFWESRLFLPIILSGFVIVSHQIQKKYFI